MSPQPAWCGSVHVGTCIYVWRGPELLMIERKGEHGDAMMSVPGGWMDKGETPERGALRELHEEVGDVQVYEHSLKFLGVTNDIFPEGVHSVTLHYTVDWRKGEPEILEPDKVAWAGWVYSPWKVYDPEDLFLPLVNLEVWKT